MNPGCFTVQIRGSRTNTIDLGSWRADITNRDRTLYTEWRTPGKIGGASFVMFWVTVVDQDHRSEPWITTQRHTNQHDWQRTNFPPTADKLITHTVARALLRHDGFDAVWDKLYRTTAVANRHGRVIANAAELRARAAWLERCAELSALLKNGELTIRTLTSAEKGYGEQRVAPVQDPFEERCFNPPAARLYAGNEQVGWISEMGNPVALVR